VDLDSLYLLVFEVLYNPQFFLPFYYSPKFWFKRF
jgi:hypothetical protein